MKAKTYRYLAAAALTAAFVFLPAVSMVRSRLLPATDFACFYANAVVWRQGGNPYDLSQQWKAQSKIGLPDFRVNVYPPFQVVVLAPFARLSFAHAFLAWSFLNLALLILYLWILWNCKLADEPLHLTLVALFFPMWIAMYLGQFSFWLLDAFALAYLLLRQRRDGAAGFALGIGLIKFPSLLPFALIFALRRRWKFIGGLLFAGVILLLISVAAMGAARMASYIRLSLAAFGGRTPAYSGFQHVSVLGAFGPKYAMLLAGLGLAAFVAFQWKQNDDDPPMYAAAIVASLIAAPYMWPHDLTPFAFAATLIASKTGCKLRVRADAVLFAALIYVYAAPLFLTLLDDRSTLSALAPGLVAIVLALVITPMRAKEKTNAKLLQEEKI